MVWPEFLGKVIRAWELVRNIFILHHAQLLCIFDCWKPRTWSGLSTRNLLNPRWELRSSWCTLVWYFWKSSNFSCVYDEFSSVTYRHFEGFSLRKANIGQRQTFSSCAGSCSSERKPFSASWIENSEMAGIDACCLVPFLRTVDKIHLSCITDQPTALRCLL